MCCSWTLSSSCTVTAAVTHPPPPPPPPTPPHTHTPHTPPSNKYCTDRWYWFISLELQILSSLSTSWVPLPRVGSLGALRPQRAPAPKPNGPERWSHSVDTHHRVPPWDDVSTWGSVQTHELQMILSGLRPLLHKQGGVQKFTLMLFSLSELQCIWPPVYLTPSVSDTQCIWPPV